MLAGIITENEHVYNTLTGKQAKMVRLIPDQGYQPTHKGVKIWVKTYIQAFDSEGKDLLIESRDATVTEPLFYTDQEIKDLFAMLNQPVNPGDDYLPEFRQMLQTVLLQDTMSKGMFNGDTCVPYVPIE